MIAGSKRKWRRILVGMLIAIGCIAILVARPAFHLIRTSLHDEVYVEVLPPGFVDDASRLNQTQIAEVWSVPEDAEAAESQLSDLLTRARNDKKKVSIAGARHSMGGHTVYPGGIVIDMLPFNHMELDESSGMLRVGAGALWSEIIPYLDRRGRSVAVMQSNNSFSVGGSISVNCHGWVYDRPPIASTVESFRLMKPDGMIVRCSRQENPELFSLALGGYGLFGIILDVELRVVPNERYRLEQFVVQVDQSLETFERTVLEKAGVHMVYARMNIVPDRLFEEIILNVFYHEPDGEPPALAASGMVELRRAIFRGSAESDYGKELRWNAETRLQPFLSKKIFSRNQLLNEGAETFQDRSAATTDILHEYFVPPDRVGGFVEQVRAILPRHRGNLLNVTVRSVNADEDSFLRYADQRMFSFVMLFSQPRKEAAEHEMARLSRDLIDAALKNGGRYYLPYRLHATRDQFDKAYPQGREFFELKRKYDPDELFQNQFYVRYGRRGA